MMPLYWIALNAIKGLGPVRIKYLLEKFDSPETIFRQPSHVLKKSGVFPDSAVNDVHNPKLLIDAEDQIRRAQRSNIHILTLKSPEYPPLLREIFAPPPVIYVRGNLAVFRKQSVAVVGTRNPSVYGKNVTTSLVQDLVKNPVTIISGLALGIDSCAHKVCLEHKGITVAVLGSGADMIYPASNRHIAERIIETGAIVSEFPLGTEPVSYNFPRRNRIISGLSAGVCVIEAGKKSGSLITAHYAVQQGREVFAVPGSIFSQKSDGTFNLIKNGAIPVQCAQDIVDNIQTFSQHTCRHVETFSSSTRIPHTLLSTEENAILCFLSQEPKRIDQIAEKTQVKITELFSILLNMELKGLVQQAAGQQYVKMQSL